MTWLKTRLTACLLATAVSAGSLQAQCAGRDVREILSEEITVQLDEYMERTPFAEGNHWRASRGEDVVHIIGTLHIDDARLGPVTERLAGIVESSEMLLLEMTKAEQDNLQTATVEQPDLIFLQDSTLPELMNETEWQTLRRAVEARGFPAVVASRLQPWYASLLISMPPCLVALSQKGPAGLDHRLQNIADQADVPTQSLEAFDTIFKLFNTKPLETQIDMLSLAAASAHHNEDMLATVTAAYFDERAMASWEISKLWMLQNSTSDQDRAEALFDMIEHDLLIARNEAWIPVILDALKTHDQITVAAGAAHLGGTSGLLALLEADGFTLERLPF